MCFFGAAKAKTVAPPPPAPTPDDSNVQTQVDNQRKRRLQAIARNNTVLTGGQGAGAAPTAGAKTLLGS